MTDYTVDADWSGKDTLTSGSPLKVVRGSEFQTEFDAISTAIATKFDSSSAVDINSGAIDNTTIGATTAASGTFTNLTASGTVSLPSSNVTIGSIDSTEIGYLNGVTSNIQTQFNNLNTSNWDAAYNDKINSASFASGTGILSLTQQDSGSVTVDLDGRYPEVTQGTFTPQFTDGTNVATATTAVGKYFTLSLNGTAYVSYVTIGLSGINTSGLTGGATAVIKGLPAAGVVAGTSNIGYEQIASFWQNIAGIPAGGQVGTQYGGSVGHFKVKIWEATGQNTCNVSNFDSTSVFILHAIMQG